MLVRDVNGLEGEGGGDWLTVMQSGREQREGRGLLENRCFFSCHAVFYTQRPARFVTYTSVFTRDMVNGVKERMDGKGGRDGVGMEVETS